MNRLAKNLQRSLLTTLMIFLVIGAFVGFIRRCDFQRSAHGDFAAPYVAATRLLHGQDPYAGQNFLTIWHAAGAPAEQRLPPAQQLIAYPPTTLGTMALFVHMPWSRAVSVYLWGCGLLYLLLLAGMMREIPGGWDSPRRLVFAAIALMLAPMHTGLHTANLTVLAFLCCGFSALLARQSYAIASGVMLTLCLSIKPTVGFTLVFFFVMAGLWRALAATMVTGLAIVGATAFQMAHINPEWRLHYKQCLAAMFASNGANSFLSTSDARFDMLNLQVPLYAIWHQAHVANVLSYLLVVGLVTVWIAFYLRRNKATQESWWAWIGSLALLSLLPIYQRNYNGVMVLFVVLWAFQNLERRSARAILAATTVFLIPGEAMLRHFGSGRVLRGLTRTPLWHTILLPHASWTVLAMACVTVCALRKTVEAGGRAPISDLAGMPELHLSAETELEVALPGS